MLVEDSFLEKIVKESNSYALDTFFGRSDMLEHSRLNKWTGITVSELKIFLGLILHMGTIKMPRLSDYWKTDPLFLSVFPQYMSRDRFFLILRHLHFNNNNDGNDKLFKIRPVIDYLNNRMSEIYYPSKELSLDEAMILWRGRLQFRQYIKNKHHKYGIKIYTLCEPNGLVLNTIVYTGKSDELGGKGHTNKILKALMTGRENHGHSLFMDNFYNSHDLSKELLEQGTHTTGTLLANRQHNPKDVVNSKLEKGETTCLFSEKHVMVGKWRDKRPPLPLY